MVNGLIRTFMIGAALFALPVSGASAAAFDFDFTFDGTSLSLDAGSTDPQGISLGIGDSFDLTVRAAGNDFWRVDPGNVFNLPLILGTEESAIRTYDAVSEFTLDGSTVNTINDLDGSQRHVHVGAQQWVLSTGFEFDAVALSYVLKSDEGAGTTIRTNDDFGFLLADSVLFANRDEFNYIEGQTNVVPVPAALPLLMTAVAGLGLVGWRRSKAA